MFGSLPLPAGLCASGSADGPRLWWITEYSRSVVPNLLAPETSFMEDKFSRAGRWGWFQDDSHKELAT